MKKDNTPFGSLFSPEFREVVKRLRDWEPEIEAVIEADPEGEEIRTEEGRGAEE